MLARSPYRTVMGIAYKRFTSVRSSSSLGSGSRTKVQALRTVTRGVGCHSTRVVASSNLAGPSKQLLFMRAPVLGACSSVVERRALGFTTDRPDCNNGVH